MSKQTLKVIRITDEAYKKLVRLAREQQRTLQATASKALAEYHYQETGKD
jgi:predicted transcriptional regulator